MLFFIVFKKFDFESEKINSLSKASFTSFLIHDYLLNYINIQEFINGNIIVLIIHIILSSIIIYLLSYIFNRIYEFVFLPFAKKISNSKILQKPINLL